MRRRSAASATSGRSRSPSVSAVADTIGTVQAEGLLRAAHGLLVEDT